MSQIRILLIRNERTLFHQRSQVIAVGGCDARVNSWRDERYVESLMDMADEVSIHLGAFRPCEPPSICGARTHLWEGYLRRMVNAANEQAPLGVSYELKMQANLGVNAPPCLHTFYTPTFMRENNAT